MRNIKSYLLILGCMVLMQLGFAQEPVTFQSGEHIYLGNNVQLYFPVDGGFKYITGAETDFRDWLQLPMDKPVTFGKIIAIPDYFADPKIVIADGKDIAEKRTFFLECFNYFTQADSQTLNKVFAIMDEEAELIKDALQKGIDPSVAYKPKDDYFNAKYATTDPLMVLLALNNFDHFGKDTWLAYQGGHAEAIATALQASKEKDPQLLVLAYAEEAYADHFLTDSFAAGHMRTPRRELSTIGVGANGGVNAIGSILVMLMHNEDNKYGLQGSNAFGNTWMAYGDDRCLDAADQGNKQMVDAAVQASVDEVIKAFRDGFETPSDHYAAANYIADIDKFYDYLNYVKSMDKTVPLFVYDSERKKLLRRRNINQLHPKQLPLVFADMKQHGGTHGWWGLTTLLELKLFYNPALSAKAYDISSFVNPDGQLNELGVSVLAKSLTGYERRLFCADGTTSKKMRWYLQCN